ncbi:Hypothetical protein FKW44_011028 [Caligus rogercresseyi]|uniref:Uncharacterized protein n=1 Tax=Caligus rogercresseyi TaxID=217165 RepID=A0A7T8HHE8_CALRO|nr:Hypothetical protein FKW44_011028 [Caligus rogercresseyi]
MVAGRVGATFRRTVETKTEPTKFVECGGGIHTRYRSCNNPEPALGGYPVLGSRKWTSLATLIPAA